MFDRLARWADAPDVAANIEREVAAEREIQLHHGLLDAIEPDPLTPMQRRAVVALERRVAVNAGAGCGKTGTIIARTAYRVVSGARRPKEILTLTFTRKAAEEMRGRLDGVDIAEFEIPSIPLDLGVTLGDVGARTYHSLAKEIAFANRPHREILTFKQSKDKKQRGDLADEDDDAEAKNKESQAVRSVLDDLIRDAHDTLPADFLMGYLFSPFVPWPDVPLSIGAFISDLKSSRISTLDGKSARSPVEAALVNTLLVAGIPHRRRPRLGDGTRPTVILGDGRRFDVKIGLRRGEIGTFVPRALQGQGGEDATTFWSTSDGSSTNIREIRAALGFPPSVTAAELGRLVKCEKYDESLDRLTYLVLNFMRRFRASAKTFRQLHASVGDARSATFVSIYETFEEVVREMLERAGYVDFDGIIREATEDLVSGRYRGPWRDIIFDEYQDVSEREIRFLEALVRAHDAAVFAVGDDWQAIYGFKGSTWDAIQNFKLRFGGGEDLEQFEYPETHRSVDRIHEPAGRFIRKNRLQTQKYLRSTRPPAHERRVEVHGVVEGPENLVTQRLAERILTQIGQDARKKRSVLVLYRGKKSAFKYAGRKAGKLGEFTVFDSMTIHKAKGLGFDDVVIVDAFRSFPGSGREDTLLELVQPPEAFRHAEQRRVFYVAMTRARERVYILTDWNRRSDFLVELADDPDVAFIDEPPPGASLPIDGMPCPECEVGRSMVGRYGGHVCTNYPFCDFVFPSCTCGGLIVINGRRAQCRRCGLDRWVCPQCRQAVVELKNDRKMARCQNYRHEYDDSCQFSRYVDRLSKFQKELLLDWSIQPQP